MTYNYLFCKNSIYYLYRRDNLLLFLSDLNILSQRKNASCRAVSRSISLIQNGTCLKSMI